MSDIDTAVVDSLKALERKRPIREGDMDQTCHVLSERSRDSRKSPVQCDADTVNSGNDHNRKPHGDQGIFDSGGRRLVRDENLELSDHRGSIWVIPKPLVKGSALIRTLLSTN